MSDILLLQTFATRHDKLKVRHPRFNYEVEYPYSFSISSDEKVFNFVAYGKYSIEFNTRIYPCLIDCLQGFVEHCKFHDIQTRHNNSLRFITEK